MICSKVPLSNSVGYNMPSEFCYLFHILHPVCVMTLSVTLMQFYNNNLYLLSKINVSQLMDVIDNNIIS